MERKEAREKARLEQMETMKGLELLKSAGIQTKLNLASSTLISRQETEKKPEVGSLTQAEKEEIRRKMLIKAQKTIFLKNFPELHEKGQIRYPIDDRLIQRFPEMHGLTNSKPSP